jgi:proton-translocating NADH-quinone oxidoreductase chain M
MSFFYVFYLFFFFFLLILLMPAQKKSIFLLRNISFIFYLFVFIIFFQDFVFFDPITISEQFFEVFLWYSFYNLHFSLMKDSISLFFLLLTCFLIPLCLLFSWRHFLYCYKELIFFITFIQFLLIIFFTVTDFIFFYICFEGILLPLFIMIGSLGSRQRRIHASFQLFFYTLIGSFFMLFGILYIFIQKGATDFSVFFYALFPVKIQLLLWFFFFLSLSVKIPLFPLHIWLPEAHVEAPTIGSVILAGVLLKMGTYGLLRFIIPVMPYANWYFNTFVQLLAFLAIIYVSIITLCQIDLKKLIAYSSVAHMGYATIALFAFNDEGLLSSVFLMLNHGIVSSLLFFIIGILYDRYKSRLLFYFQGLSRYMPIFSWIVFMAMVANIGFPGTSSFIAEFLVVVSLISLNKIIVFYNGIGIIFSAFYSFWLYNRIFFGPNPNKFITFADISLREFFVCFPFVLFIFLYGLFPNLLLNMLQFTLSSLYFNSPFNYIL